MTRPPRPILSDQFVKALIDAGVVRGDDLIKRLVIDAQVNHAVVIYVERLGDERLLNVALALNGIEIRTWREAIDVPAGQAAGEPADTA